MGFNYASEKRRFDAEWSVLAEQYREAGFDETGIQAMREFDWEWFCQRRTYENRIQLLPSEVIDNNDDESRSTLFKKFTSLSVSFGESEFMGRFGWIDAVTNPILSDKLAVLSDADKELLTLLVIDGYKQTEIAILQGCSKVTVCKKIKRIKIFLNQG